MEKTKKASSKYVKITALALFALAVVPRLIFIFFISTPDNPGAGWFGDAYHHWQIAYLTKEIGLHQSFLRLWDLKGMEYFWGLLHPLFTMLAFAVTGSNSVGAERGMTAIFGSISVVLIYFLGRRFWNNKVALAAALFAALNPVGVFNDGTGMVEPVGIPFLLLGVLAWPAKPALAGLSFAIALMARGEYWVFSLGLVLAMLVFSKGKKAKFDNKLILGISFAASVGVYMKYLLNYTNNPIYPFYWNYVANIYGEWQLKPVLTHEDIVAKYTFLSIFIISVVAALTVLWKKPKGKYLYLLGLGNWIFLGATFGLGQYIKSYVSYVWYVRFMILPYAFLGVVLAVLLFYVMPKTKGLKALAKTHVNWLIFFAILGASQLVWQPIWKKYSSTQATWQQAESIADKIAEHYNGGGLLLMEGNPEITYALVRNHDVKGRDITGEMFDPYYYMEDDPYANWGDNRVIVLNWLKENNVRTIATYFQFERYAKLVEKEPQFFEEGVAIKDTNIIIYQVKDELYKQEIQL